jgi:hypothetical protein
MEKIKFTISSASGELLFIMTSPAYPEQYDVLDHLGRKAGYVRLRHGELHCTYPDVGGQEIYAHDFADHLGAFENSNQRMEHLTAIAEAVHAKKRAIREANKRKYARMNARYSA